MTTLRRTILILSAAAPLFLLSACDGYEMRLYDGFPYGGARTAGHGVEYVLAKMMPTKGPVTEPVAEPPAPPPAPEPEIAPPPPPPEEPMTKGDEMIEHKARK